MADFSGFLFDPFVDLPVSSELLKVTFVSCNGVYCYSG